MTFLELAQMTTRQTGTIQGVVPTTVVGQINRLKQIVEFVSEAYVDIQNAHRMWRWMQGQFTGQTEIGVQKYAYGLLSDEDSATPITRFSQWGFKQDGSDNSMSIYKTADGPIEEGAMRWLDWDAFYTTQLRGVVPPAKPQFYSINNANELVISPAPDDVYTLRGPYRKGAQVLTADGDIPEMPVEFHTLIKDAALCYVEGFDEGPRIPTYRLRMLPNWSMLELHQLPRTKWGFPLA